METLKTLQQSKQRHHNAVSLQQLLKIQLEMVVEAKAQEEVLSCIMQSHLQEFEENKESHENLISQLRARNNDLQQQLSIDKIRQLQTENELTTTGQMKKVLLEHHEALKNQFKITDGIVKRMEQEHKQQVQNYQTKKSQLQELIDEENKTLLEIRDSSQEAYTKFKSEFDKKINAIKELNDAYNRMRNEIEELNKNLSNLNEEININQEVLQKLDLEQKFIDNLLNNINLEDLEIQLKTQQEQHDSVLKTLNTDLNNTTECLAKYEQSELILQEQLTKENNLFDGHNSTLSQLEDQHSLLLQTVKDLTDKKDTFNKKSKSVSENLNLELEEINSKLMKVNENINQTVSIKNEKLKILHNIKESIREQQKRVLEAQCLFEELTSSNEVTKLKINELKQREIILKSNIENSKSSLLQLKQQHLNDKVAKMQKLAELDENIRKNRNILETIKIESANKIKVVADELTAYKAKQTSAFEENQQNYNKKLEELQNRLINRKNDLAEVNQQVTELQQSIAISNAENAKLEEEYDTVLETASFTSESRTSRTASNIAAVKSILKPPKPYPTPTKSVSFGDSTNTAYESDEVPQKLTPSTPTVDELNCVEPSPKYSKYH